MINRNEAERLAAAMNALRPDWPVAQLVTLIGELRSWPIRDLGCALTWIALDHNIDGSPTTSSPYRVKEDGPWRAESEDAAALALARRRAEAERQQRLGDISARSRATHACDICDEYGRLPGDILCSHDDDPTARAERAAARKAYASKHIRPTVRTS